MYAQQIPVYAHKSPTVGLLYTEKRPTVGLFCTIYAHHIPVHAQKRHTHVCKHTHTVHAQKSPTVEGVFFKSIF